MSTTPEPMTGVSDEARTFRGDVTAPSDITVGDDAVELAGRALFAWDTEDNPNEPTWGLLTDAQRAVWQSGARAALEAAAPLLVRDAVAERDAEIERIKAEHRAFTSRLGFGDGVTEPAATLAEMIDPIEQAFSDANDFHEMPRLCELCGEWLASEDCGHCNGSGCGPGTAHGAYSECEWCAGVGRVHPGCVEESCDGLVLQRDAARDELAGVVAAVEAVHQPVEVHKYDVINGEFVMDEHDNPMVTHRLCRECTSDLTLNLLDGYEWSEDEPGSVYWPCATRTALSSTGAGEALARVREQAWDEGWGAGAEAERVGGSVGNPYAEPEKGCGDE